MLRMIQSNAAAHAKDYFVDALLKSDYFINDQELPGYWQGKLAVRLGLSGATAKDDFFALCENRHPQTGHALTPRTKENRRTGYDINFHCPKSVSVLHAFAQDDHILQAFQDSVTATMQLIEADSKTRIRRGGIADDRQTGELIWAHFVHQTARPVEGCLPDPHLHSHCFVFNATWDETEQRMKAGQFHDIKRDMPFYQAYFHKTLSDRLQTLGYRIRRTDKSFEIEGVPQRAIDLFSKRTDEIGRMAKAKGITDAKELGALGARTRAKKQKGTSMKELIAAWRAQVLAGKDKDESDVVRFDKNIETPQLSARQCLDHALLHCFERASVVPDRRLLEVAYRHGIGAASVSAADIHHLFRNDTRLIHITEKSRFLCTTKEVLKEEKRMVDLARQGQGKFAPLYREAPSLNLKGQQAAAVTHVLTTPHRVSIIRGAAGTGKTTLMQEAVSHIKNAGKTVTVIAPTAQASRGVLRQEGFDQAETVAKFLFDILMQQSIKDQVLWVDEAGLLGTKDMTALLEVTTKQNARLILGGDTRQHASVVRGDALRILNTVAGIQTAEVSKIYRQKNEQYRAAVEDLSRGDVPAAFKKLDQMGAIKTTDSKAPNELLIKDYMAALHQGKSALIIAPTHVQGEAVTADIRKQLRIDKLLGKKEITVTRLINLNLTEAEKADHRNFKEGQVIQFNQNAPGFQRGSLWHVQSTVDKNILLRNVGGEEKPLPTQKSGSYDVYAQADIALSKGDHVRITRGSFDDNNKRLNNGQMLKVISVAKKGTITLRNDQSKTTYTIDKDFGHIAHAHCVTSHASQGKTVDEVFISQPAATFPATDAKQFYVSVSRARDKVHIYTDDKPALLHHASALNDRQSAIEATSKTTTTHHELVQQKQRSNLYTSKSKQKDKSLTKQRESYEPEI